MKIQKNKNGCWEWTGARDGNGYGNLFDGEKMQKAHRLSHAIFIGPIPEKMLVMHSCDNPPCVNPKHLKAATYSENMQDASLKNRWTAISFFRNPETHSHAKLDWDKVMKMRKMYASKFYTCAELGREFSVSSATARAIVLNKTWRWKDKKDWFKKKKEIVREQFPPEHPDDF